MKNIQNLQAKAIGAKYNRYCDGFLGKIEEEGKELY